MSQNRSFTTFRMTKKLGFKSTLHVRRIDKPESCHCEEERRSNLVAILIDQNAMRLPRCARNDIWEKTRQNEPPPQLFSYLFNHSDHILFAMLGFGFLESLVSYFSQW
ncbi:hypothetical protein SAMN05421821_11239 [Mucilaginibacter lappiensis]|nr:hypothetical protein SAMN05421821_11239 [Mucilaginibacter lappiensis]